MLASGRDGAGNVHQSNAERPRTPTFRLGRAAKLGRLAATNLRWIMRRILTLFMLSTLAFSFPAGCYSKEEGAAAVAKAGESLKWDWSKEKASLAYSIKQHLPDYEVERVREKEYYTPINIRTKKDRKVIYSLENGHENTVFTRWKDILYIAEYSPIATGCEVVALDLNTGKLLWKTQLEGIGPTGHSKYLNLVNIQTDGQKVIVTGNEAHGRYVEHLDLQSGRALANKKFNADPDSLLGG